MSDRPNYFTDLVITKPDGHQFTVFQLFTDFVYLPCPVCKSEHSDFAGKPRYQKAGANRAAVVEIPMLCRNGHKWNVRLMNMRGETSLACSSRSLT